MIQLRKIINSLFYSDNLRTQLVKRNIIGIILLRGVNVVTNFLLVPMTIDYLNPTEYGIWLTLSSVLMWVNVFDFGLGYGLRNKIAEAYAVDDLEKIKIYISTGFVVLTVLSICLFLIFNLVNTYIEWDKLLNIDKSTGDKLSMIVLWVMFFFCIQFVARLIDVITAANQRSMLGTSISVIGNIIVLFVIGLLTHFCKSSLLYVAVAFSSIPVFVYLLFNYILFRTKYKNICPSLKWIKVSCVKDIVGLGGKFFIIQISTILMFSSSNVIIAKALGPEEVTVYNIAYKYFSIVIMLFTIISAPLWSAFTDAYIRRDFIWINTTVKKVQKIWLIGILVSFLMLLVSKQFYHIWVGEKLEVPLSLSLAMAIYVIVFNFHAMYIYFINGVGKVFIQLLHAIFSFLLFIPLSWYACKNFGSIGIVSVSTILIFPLSVCSFIQYHKILSGKDTGIWSK